MVSQRPLRSQERQQQSDLHCPCILLGRDRHCSSAHFHCHQQHSSQERPMKVLASPLLSLSCTDAYPGGKVVNKVIILWHPHCSLLRQRPGIPCLLAFYHRYSRVVQKAKELVPRMSILDYNTTKIHISYYFIQLFY